MQLDHKHKEIIKSMLNGRVYNIFTYITEFSLGRIIKYNKNKVDNDFKTDSISKRYYWNKNRIRSSTNICSEAEYKLKCENNEINPDNYTFDDLTLCYPCGIREVMWNENRYIFNFYDGVYVANSFSDILDFLSLCQYLKSEMLVLEVPDQDYKSTLSLFFEKKENLNQESYIDFKKLTCADTKYISEFYNFSEKHCVICSEYIGKRFYPSPRLNLYVKQGFKTPEEKSQRAALTAAWIAIFISIIATVLPHVIGKNDDYSKDVADCVQVIKESITQDVTDCLREIKDSVSQIIPEKDVKSFYLQNAKRFDDLIVEINKIHHILLYNQEDEDIE